MVVIPKRTALQQAPSGGKSDKKSNNISGSATQSSVLVLARSIQGKRGPILVVPQDMVLVKQSALFAKTNSQNQPKIKILGSGWRWTLPGLNFNTFIRIQPFSKDYGMVSLDSLDYSEMKINPIVRMSVIDVDKFYYSFCGNGYSAVLTQDDKRLKMLYDEIRQVFEQIVTSNFFDDLKKYKLSSTKQIRTIEYDVPVGNKTKHIKEDVVSIQYDQAGMSDDLFEIVCKRLAEIRNRFGIYVETIGFSDPNKPEIIVEQERREIINRSENEMKIANAKTRKEESVLELEAAKNEAAGIKAKEEAKYGGRLDAHLDRDFSIDQTIDAMYAESGRNVNVRGNAVPFINISDDDHLDDDLGNNQHVKRL